MKIKKFKIRIRDPHLSPEEDFKNRLINSLKPATNTDKDYDLVLSLPNISWIPRILSKEKIRIIQAVKEKKPESIYKLSKILGRAHTNVYKDVMELAGFGIIVLKKVKKKGQKRETISPEYHWDGFDIAV